MSERDDISHDNSESICIVDGVLGYSGKSVLIKVRMLLLKCLLALAVCIHDFVVFGP